MINERFLDALTKKIMNNPVVARDGYVYDQSTIDKWEYSFSPLNNEKPMEKGYIPFTELKNQIQEFLGDYHITVTHSTAPSKAKYEVIVGKNADVNELKDAIYKICYLPAEGQSLYFGEKDINENMKLSEYGITDNSNIEMRRKANYVQPEGTIRICPVCKGVVEKGPNVCDAVICPGNQIHPGSIIFCYKCPSGESPLFSNFDDGHYHLKLH